MKYPALLTALLLCTAWMLSAQSTIPDTSGLTLDALQIPNSPAFALMDLAPATIDEPKVPSDFLVYLRNATDSFTTIPRSYGIEFAPAWVWGKDRIDFTRFSRNKLGSNIWQSMVVSMGVNHLGDAEGPPADQITQLGVGLKFSLLRGDLDDNHQRIFQLYQSLDSVNRLLALDASARCNADDSCRYYLRMVDSLSALPNAAANEAAINRYGQLWAGRNNVLQRDAQLSTPTVNAIQQLKARTAGLKLNRRGFKLDFAVGAATNFLDQSFDYSKVARVGAWFTGGWVFEPSPNKLNASILGLVRVMGNPDQLYKPAGMDTIMMDDNLFFDYGARVILHNGKKFSFSSELLGRAPINNDALKSTWRFSVNADYQVSKTITLTFQFGKNFDGTTTEGGNLMTALHMFTAFGKRKLKQGTLQ
ncbi:MAG: hypothetical protein SFV22_04150 [Saprospiraceae bacterium]|nr:hypothetical protein [Saprospiraceae bacterium]